MKLSELSTDQALDALCELTPYISNITSDEELVKTLGKVIEFDENQNMYGRFALLTGRAGELAPLLLKTHRADVYGILSVVNQRSAADIAAQKITVTIQQIREVFQDEDMLHFFKSSARQEKTAQSALSADSHAYE